MRNFSFQSTVHYISGFFLILILGSFSSVSTVAARDSAAMAIDAHTGQVLYAHNVDKPHHPASLTKIMTLYMLFEFIESGRLTMDSKLTITQNASNQAPSKLGLKPGATIRVEDAIRALVTKSANDIAVTVAENLAGSEWKFTKLMTWKARKLGMSKTTFVNASGLPNSRQVTTARDMITLSMRIQKDFPQFYPYFSLRHFSYAGRRYKNHNKLLTRMKGIDGIKTGYTRASGFNLTSSVWNGRKHVVGVVLGGKTGRKRDDTMIHVLRKSLRKARNGVTKKQFVAANYALKTSRRQVAQVESNVEEPVAVNAVAPKQVKPVGHVKKDLSRLENTQQAAYKVADGNEQSNANVVADNEVDTSSVDAPGPYHIQVGAFGNQEDAQRRLHSIGTSASSLLKGHNSVTMLVPQNNVYRARFTGFSEADARSTCKLLKRKSIDCLAVPAQ